MASPLARRLAEAAITELRRASSGPSLTIALMAAPSAGSILVSAACPASRMSCYTVTFPAASSASSVLGSSPTPSAAPSAVYVFIPAAPPTCSTSVPADTFTAASAAASSALGSSSTPSPTFHASTSLAASAASIVLDTSPAPAPFRSSLAVISSGAEDDREYGSDASHIRNDIRNYDRWCSSNWAWTPWEPTRPKEMPGSPQNFCSRRVFVPIRSRPFSSVTATPTPSPPPADLSPRTVMFLINFLNGLVLTKDEELMFRKAFNDKFSHFKVSDIISHLQNEKFTFEEYCFMLKIIHSKLGQNRGLAELVLQEDINLSPTNDEIERNPQLSRLECKVDILTKKFDKGNADVLKCVRVSSKGEWGTVEVFGKKLDLTKLESVRKLITIITGV